ncbi:MAG: precorrin-8X methylmutase [Nitrospirae bacterium]|nr:precorrin-8X methylmutase [Nitrospirota bacterium]
MESILLLGHGSRLTEANNTLIQMAQMVRTMGDIPIVEAAFMQFGRPDFSDGVSACVSKGARKIIVLPYFLYKGRHYEEDIPALIDDAQKKHNEIEFSITEPLGLHENIAKVALERLKKDIRTFKRLRPCEIEEKSFEIITDELGETRFRDIELPVVKRVIHTTGDFDFVKNMQFHPRAIEAGLKAIRNGMNILVDVHMVETGINKHLLEKSGGRVICKLSDSETGGDESLRTGKTRTEIAMEMGAGENVGIVVVGNAPTALYRVMNLIQEGVFNPELVIGVPVGFVSAVESKEVLLHVNYPFITSLGRKGGSTVAAAIVNALLKMT